MEILRDTDPAVEEYYFARLREVSPSDKLALISAWCRAVQEIAIAGIRARHPGASDEEVRLRLGSLRLPRETMIEVYGWDPDEKGYG